MTFKIHENTILSAPRLTLPNNDSRHNLLPEIRLPLLDSGHYHITNASRRQAVQATLNSLHGYDVKVLSTSVISTVHCCCHWQTQWHPELVTSWSSTSCIFIQPTTNNNKNNSVKDLTIMRNKARDLRWFWLLAETKQEICDDFALFCVIPMNSERKEK